MFGFDAWDRNFVTLVVCESLLNIRQRRWRGRGGTNLGGELTEPLATAKDAMVRSHSQYGCSLWGTKRRPHVEHHAVIVGQSEQSDARNVRLQDGQPAPRHLCVSLACLLHRDFVAGELDRPPLELVGMEEGLSSKMSAARVARRVVILPFISPLVIESQ